MGDPKRWRSIGYWTKRVLFWLGSDRPWRMYSRGRTADAEFNPTELLFFRFAAENMDDTGEFRLAAIRFPDQSVNREKYSRPLDVLIPDPRRVDTAGRSRKWLCCGVAAFPVGCVPTRLENERSEENCDVRVEHDPIEYDYAHSEIRAFLNNKRLLDKKGVSPSVRKEFRMRLFEHTRVVVKPLQ